MAQALWWGGDFEPSQTEANNECMNRHDGVTCYYGDKTTAE